MCGRYATARSAGDISAFFDAHDDTAAELAPSWNVAPTDPVPVVRVSRSRECRVLSTARWGLVPAWAADARGGARMINARSETVAGSPAFAASFAKRRCLVPADGWYEWVRGEGGKRAYFMTPRDGAPLAFAGLWSAWGPDALLTCTVLTAPARGALAAVHDRMPLLLAPDRWPQWLNGGADNAELLCPTPEWLIEEIDVRPVGSAVGNVRNNGPELTARVAAEQVQDRPELTLF